MKTTLQKAIRALRILIIVTIALFLGVLALNKPNPEEGIHVHLEQTDGVKAWFGRKLWRASESWNDWKVTNLGVAHVAKAEIRGKEATAVGVNGKWYLVSYQQSK
jgi:chorismate mutase